MDATVVGALIGFGGSTVAQVVAGYVSSRREQQTLNEGRLRELAQIIDAADTALTTGQRHLNEAGSLAQQIGAAGPITQDRWERERTAARDQMTDDLNTLWTHSNLIRLRVADDHSLSQSFEQATEGLGQATTAMEELLESGVDRQQRQPIWKQLREGRDNTRGAQREFEAAARKLLAPRLARRRPMLKIGGGD